MLYHPGKANVVADTLSRKWEGIAANMMLHEWKLLEDFVEWKPFEIPEKKAIVASLKCGSEITEKVLEAQGSATELPDMLEASKRENSELRITTDGGVRFRNRLWVPAIEDLRREVLNEAHRSKYSIHPRSIKMWRDLQKNFWWKGMKKDIVDFVSKCLVCQQVKIEHQRPAGLMQRIDLPTWKWEHITMDFVVGLPKTRKNHDAIYMDDCRPTYEISSFPAIQCHSVLRRIS